MSVAPPNVVVRVKFANRRQLKNTWAKDISKGGIFLRTAQPPAVFSSVTVILELPDQSTIEVHGKVVHIIAPEQATEKMAAGMGVQFVDFTPDKRRIVEGFLDKNKTVLPSATGARGVLGIGAAPSAPGLDTFIHSLRRLIWLCGDAAALAENDYYLLLGIPPTSSTEQIKHACGILRVLLDPGEAPDGLADADRTRIQAMSSTLAEVESTLCDPPSRLQYDSARLGLLR